MNILCMLNNYFYLMIVSYMLEIRVKASCHVVGDIRNCSPQSDKHYNTDDATAQNPQDQIRFVGVFIHAAQQPHVPNNV